MGIEQVIQQAQSRRQLREQAREKAAASFFALDKADRAELLAEFVDAVMEDEAAHSEPAPVPAPPTRAGVLARNGESKRSKTDQAEELVKSRPGITTKEIAAYIKQSPRTAGSTLAQLAKNRGSIRSKNGGWYPVTSKTSKATEGGGSKIRDSIVHVMNDKVPRGTGDIIRTITEHDRDANKRSINAQIYRMANMDPPMLIKHSDGERGPLWVLASGDIKAQDAKGTPAA